MSTATAQAAAPAKKRGSGLFQGLQKVGRSLQLPIAVLPAAGILLRLGQDDVFGKDGLGWDKVAKVFATAGDAVFANLPLLFCVGIAIGFAKKADGSTALAALVGFLVYKNVLTAFPVTEGVVNTTKNNGVDVAATYNDPKVLGGIVMGLLAAVIWQRYHRTKLVDWLGFFNGRRLVPIIMAFVGTVMGVFFGLVWEPIGNVITNFGEWMTGLGAVGAGIFGVVNRGLLPIGMHQFVNTVAWQEIGSYKDSAGAVWHGDLPRFFHGDPTAGQFMSGFFPIMMFALPAAALAITHCARPERRKVVGGMMVSLALTSFVTGITEPIEFAFMFIAPVLYVIHAILTAIAMAVTWALGVHHGFSFSAGAIDYFLNWGLATKPWMIIPIGLVFAAIYYVVFRFAITKFNLPTPGRESDEELAELQKAEAK
ncbi:MULTISPECIES: PTS transporter subunit EIIC [Streptomyces]|uniref:PTS system, N-acetylglucosamine-specific IIB component or PTS system, N-acetylglucosamine-specific IIC component n=1 Tax=Streptomyces venezuelae (strain ATCC 10712 / CBS 650.69 / DSM 40230 / JCM 4526 / NBRC 13096 / PD 04745) TaxID=953739 RepID=F2R4S4_STRVP|nr:PTS transporter subunit EIIC [Streptomyces venezuelae]APE21849.1 PTS lactose transporter subunit IIC [Streptomyces venezuelae]QER99243.1 PTS lactose transporter subunit IIC [Streptomyces venezuelae ATCC 10712]CCA55945.1 PTS system, N-acetylglucosamine-specific IIB component or PTS system, N-acetylglucosamine-specific IIC component [Streptomyces venezuelae ATCC 10712]